ncbi:hypothetical protein BH11VER1_BH11VER1_40080 [soil metagenome]
MTWLFEAACNAMVEPGTHMSAQHGMGDRASAITIGLQSCYLRLKHFVITMKLANLSHAGIEYPSRF